METRQWRPEGQLGWLPVDLRAVRGLEIFLVPTWSRCSSLKAMEPGEFR